MKNYAAEALAFQKLVAIVSDEGHIGLNFGVRE